MPDTARNDRSPTNTTSPMQVTFTGVGKGMPVGSACIRFFAYVVARIFRASKALYPESVDLGAAEASRGTDDRRRPAWVRGRPEFAVAPYLRKDDPRTFEDCLSCLTKGGSPGWPDRGAAN